MNFVRNGRVRHRRAEIIFGADFRDDFIAERDRLFRRVDDDFVFRLAVFFESERTVSKENIAIKSRQRHVVNAEFRVAGNFERIGETAEFVQNDLFFLRFFAGRIINFASYFFSGPIAFVGGVVPRGSDPKLELRLLFRAIDRAVGNKVRATIYQRRRIDVRINLQNVF